MSEVLVEVTRGPLVELIYQGEIAVVDAAGRLLYAVGDPAGKQTYWRSAAKPFQAMPLVYTGAAARYGMDQEDLALTCASHNGEALHTHRAGGILERLGLDAGSLQCGAHEPFDKASAAELIRREQSPGPLHNNCSGKHSGMLALSMHLGFDPLAYQPATAAPTPNALAGAAPTAAQGPISYLDPQHPVQQVILENVAAVTGLAASDLYLGVDGCGVPTFGLSIYHMALAFARLADPTGIPPAAAADAPLPPGYRPPQPEARRAAAYQVRAAMMSHPYLVAGHRRFDTALMQAAPGKLVSKIGAAGVWCVGILPQAAAAVPALQGARGGVGIALKVEDNTLEGGPREKAAVEVLAQLGVLGPAELEQLAHYHKAAVRNVAGRTVGEHRAVFRLTPP